MTFLLSLIQLLLSVQPLAGRTFLCAELAHYALTGDDSRCAEAERLMDERIAAGERGAVTRARLARSFRYHLDRQLRGGSPNPDSVDYFARRLRDLDRNEPMIRGRLLTDQTRRQGFRLCRRVIQLGRQLLWLH